MKTRTEMSMPDQLSAAFLKSRASEEVSCTSRAYILAPVINQHQTYISQENRQMLLNFNMLSC